MLKRMRYISELAEDLGPGEIERIGRLAAEANEKDQITGMLVASGKLFFQIIEGPEDAIDRLWARISRDPRHRNMLVLAEERGDLPRLCPDWGMRQVDLDAGGQRRDNALRTILKVIHSQRAVMDELMCTLEESVWHGLLEADASASKASS